MTRHEDVATYDAATAATYDADREGEEHWRAENDFVAGFAARHDLGAVLDVPVGTGRLLPHLDGALRIVGLDVSRDMLERAAAVRLPLDRVTPELSLGDALDLEHDDDTFDTVVCFRLAHLLPPEAVPALFGELGRVCAGTLLVQTYAYPIVTRPVIWRRLGRRAARLVRRPVPESATPWSHIQSYSHTAAFLDDCVDMAGLRLVRRHHISDYGRAAVHVLELRGR